MITIVQLGCPRTEVELTNSRQIAPHVPYVPCGGTVILEQRSYAVRTRHTWRHNSEEGCVPFRQPPMPRPSSSRGETAIDSRASTARRKHAVIAAWKRSMSSRVAGGHTYATVGKLWIHDLRYCAQCNHKPHKRANSVRAVLAASARPVNEVRKHKRCDLSYQDGADWTAVMRTTDSTTAVPHLEPVAVLLRLPAGASITAGAAKVVQHHVARALLHRGMQHQGPAHQRKWLHHGSSDCSAKARTCSGFR